MRWLTVLAVLCLVAPASAQENDAEKLYRAMEKKIRGAKTLNVVIDGEFDAQVVKGTIKGKAFTASGSKARMEMDMAFGGQAKKVLFITDGKVGYSKLDDMANVDPDPKKIAQVDRLLPGMMARAGLAAVLMAVRSADPNKQEDFDLDKDAAIKNFKLGAKEMVGQRNAQVVEYQIDLKGKIAKASVWIDTKTQLPLKRVLMLEEMGQNVTITETYSSFIVDGKLDPKLFEVPPQ
jgi:outer membrane lipoprotein-sorting protein